MEVPAIRVLIADDHAVLRAGLQLLIDAQPDLSTIGHAKDGLEALAQINALHPDVILLDLSMPDGGLPLIAQLLAAAPQSRVLVLTMHTEDEYLREALRLGASGYLVKASAEQELLSAIRAVARGEIYVHSAMTRVLVEDLQHPARTARKELWDELSHREKQVLTRVAQGFTNRQVADDLELSIKTVETYRARGMEKLDLHTRAQLVHYAARFGLLT